MIERLEQWSVERPWRRALTFLGDGENETETLDFGELRDAALGFAGELSGRDVAGRSVLVLPSNAIAFAVAFLGCLYAGAIAVPCSIGPRNRGRERIAAIAGDCQPVVAVIGITEADSLIAMLEELHIPSVRVSTAYPKKNALTMVRSPSVPALLQYTSGSTGFPKGVVITGANLAANLQMMVKAFGIHDESVYLTWLPLFHDMGLIAHLLTAIYSGVPCILMHPMRFYQRPDRWLRAMSRFGATISGGPNFAFELLLRRHARLDLSGVNLRSWDVAFCGAEVVRASTMRQFADRFAAVGFGTGALFPCYGLAEATVFVSGSEPGRGLRTIRHDDRDVVSCGRPAAGTVVAIVDPDDMTPIAEGGTGEIWVAGGHISPGYWNKPEISDPTFKATLRSMRDTTFLRTGDLGWLRDGELYFAGRLKDLIIWHGSNLFPEDIEATAANCDPDFAAANAAFAVDIGGEEAIVLLQEVSPSQSFEPAAALARVMTAVVEAHGFPMYEVALVRRGTLPRTTSGKVQRKRCRDLYRSGLPAEMLIETLRTIRSQKLALG